MLIKAWLEEESEHRGQKFFVDYKNRVWHHSVSKVIETLVESRRLDQMTFFSNDKNDWLELFARILILSADYEEQ